MYLYHVFISYTYIMYLYHVELFISCIYIMYVKKA